MPKYATIFTPTPRGVTTFALASRGTTTFALASRGTTTFSKVASGEIPSSGYRLGRSAYALTGSGLGIALGRGVAIGRSALTVHGNALTVNVGYGATVGASALGSATRALTLRVGHTLAASSSALTINGRPLAFAASGAFTGIMGAAALHLAPHQLAPVASVNVAAGATTLTHTSKTLGVTASVIMVSSASVMSYAGSVLGVATTSSVSFSGAVGTGSVALNPRTLSVTAGTSFVGALTPSHLTLTTKTPMASTSQVLDMAELSIVITGTLQQVVATTGMTLTGDIADGTVGGTVDAHLTLGGNITYPVTISGLPSWITNPGSIASGTDVHLTGTYPVQAQTYTFTPTATDSSATPQTATDAQSVVVSASAQPTVVQQSVAVNVYSATATLTLPVAPTPGNHLVLRGFMAHTEYSVTSLAGWTRVSSMPQQSSSVGVDAWIRAVQTGDGATVTVTRSTSHHMAWVLSEVANASGVASSVDYIVGQNGVASMGITLPIGASNALPMIWAGEYSGGGWAPTLPSGWSVDASVGLLSGYTPMIAGSRDTPSDGAAIAITVMTGNSVDNRAALAGFLMEATP